MARVHALSCPNCGAPLHHGNLECRYCGTALYAGCTAEATAPALAEAQKAIPDLLARLKWNPYDGSAYFQLGMACLTLKLNEQAQDAFKQALHFLPGDPLVPYFYGLSILRCSEPDILSIKEPQILQMKKQFETAVFLDPDLAEADLYCAFADALYARNQGKYAGALEPLRRVIQALPYYAAPWKVLATCCFQAMDFEGATLAGIRFLQLEPQDADMAYLVGAAYAQMKQVDEAEAWARRVATLRRRPSQWKRILREFRGEVE